LVDAVNSHSNCFIVTLSEKLYAYHVAYIGGAFTSSQNSHITDTHAFLTRPL